MALPNYGLDKELKDKAASAYSADDEATVRTWLERVTGEEFPSDEFAEGLKDGVLLCLAAQAVQPDLIKQINQSRMPFKKMENIKNFLQASRSLGMKEHEVFCTPDLFEEKNMGRVVLHMFQFARIAAKHPGFKGPTIEECGAAPLVEGKAAEAQSWMEAVLDDQMAGGFADEISNGVLLCRLINCIIPDKVPKIHNSRLPIKKMENIQAFLDAASELGVADDDICTMPDVLEAANPEAVARTVLAVATCAQGRGWSGPMPAGAGAAAGGDAAVEAMAAQVGAMSTEPEEAEAEAAESEEEGQEEEEEEGPLMQDGWLWVPERDDWVWVGDDWEVGDPIPEPDSDEEDGEDEEEG